MNLRKFYATVRQEEEAIAEAFPVVISLETPDGGKAGVASEVSRANAAKLIAESKVRLATEGEAVKFREEAAEAKRLADQAAAAAKVQVTVISEAELRALRTKGKG